MLITKGRRAIATVVVIATAALAAAAMVWYVLPSEEPHYEALFADDLTEDEWPPSSPASLEDELATTEAMRRIGLAGLVQDASVPPAGARNPGDVPGLHVRAGTAQGLYYIEAVFGEDASFDDVMPMAVLIHGRGDRARIPGGPFWGLGTPLRVIVPQAPDPLGNGFEWLPVRVGQNLVDRLTTSLMARAGQLAAFLRELMVEVPTVGRAIVVGFSQGGLLTFTLATHFGDVVEAAFPLAAWLPPALVPPYARTVLPYPPIRGVHGDADPIIPVDPTEDLYATLRAREIDAELVTFPGVEHEMSADMNAQLHEWLKEAVDRVIVGGVADGVLDGGAPPCAEASAVEWPEGGWPDGSPDWPEGGWPEGGWPEGGWLPPCPDGGPLDLDASVPRDASPMDGGVGATE